MTGDEIGFSEISDVFRNERRSKILSKLPVNFYTKAEEHIQKLRSEHCTAILVPNNPNSMMLWDQISKIDKRLKNIYEIRERKITLAALDKMVGALQPDNMTKRDKALYDQLVGTLTAFRNQSELQDCPPPVKVPESRPEPEKFTQPKLVEPEPAIEILSPASEETIIVHVLEDIPTFVGLNNTYDLKKDDMVTLPSQFASLLSSKGKVRIVSG
jgi:DNA replication initiation complex subunit (GINS family)